MDGQRDILVLDNLSSGSLKNLKQRLDKPNFKFILGDLLNPSDIAGAVEGCEIIYHLAANPEVRLSLASPDVHFRQNITATYNLLEALRRAGCVKTLVFTSSSTVYGEALITAYAHTYGFNAIIYRLANIIGSRSRHGVIHDFIQKLRKNQRELEVLGDGTQTKSYLYIDDCIKAMLIGVEKVEKLVEVFNVGSEDQIEVKTIAKIVTEEMGLKDVKFRYTGGVRGGRGWIGDVKNMLLDVSKLKSLGSFLPDLDHLYMHRFLLHNFFFLVASSVALRSPALTLGILLHFLEDALTSNFNTLFYPLFLVDLGLNQMWLYSKEVNFTFVGLLLAILLLREKLILEKRERA